MTAPAWMTDAQRAAHDRGVAAADAPAAGGAAADARIALADVTTFRCPAHLTADFDPTYRPPSRRAGKA